MADAVDILGTVFKNGTATLLARVVGGDDTPLVQADVSAITYSIHELDRHVPDTRVAVANHQSVSVSVAASIFDTLQTDSRWTADETGYNFLHTIDIATNNAFEKAGTLYLVEYTILPVAGQKILVRFKLECI